MQFDIAIVGAGIAGNSAAYELARKGYKVIVLEKKKEIGGKICGGLVSKRVINLQKTDAILNEIKGAYVHFPNGKEICIGGEKTHAYVIDRDKFVNEIAEKAMAEGAIYKLNFLVRKICQNKIYGKEEIKFEYLIGADGAKSNVAKLFNMGKISYINAIQGEGKKLEEDFVRVYLDNELFPNFFGWIIPADEKARIGLGYQSKKLKEKINIFARKIDRKIDNCKAGLIPYGLRKFYRKNLALIGDSAGQVKATSGGGIYASLLASKILAESFPDFKMYEKIFMEKFGKELKRHLLMRRIYRKLKNEDLNFIANYIEENVELINKYGDIDYQWKVAKEFMKKNPKFLIALIWKILK